MQQSGGGEGEEAADGEESAPVQRTVNVRIEGDPLNFLPHSRYLRLPTPVPVWCSAINATKYVSRIPYAVPHASSSMPIFDRNTACLFALQSGTAACKYEIHFIEAQGIKDPCASDYEDQWQGRLFRQAC